MKCQHCGGRLTRDDTGRWYLSEPGAPFVYGCASATFKTSFRHEPYDQGTDVRPRLLDLYSCAGGAAMGYFRAGFRVVGIDIEPQEGYPFEHIVADAIEYVTEHGHEYDVIHASPPCQLYSSLNNVHKRDYPDLIAPTRVALEATGKPYVIENVQGAPLRLDVMLCGEMFGLKVLRHRFFELGRWKMAQPGHPGHQGVVSGWKGGEYIDGEYHAVYGNGGGKGTIEAWQQAMGIDWMQTRHELAEAIPPAYTEAIGRRLLEAL